MKSYHGYITPQGIAAEKERELRVKNLVPEILAIVMKLGKVRISNLDRYLPGADSKEVRQAVWKLMDRKVLRITSDQCLAMNI